ncbi:hypothetical protein, partial [Dolichospermum planctonicum]|uniref:hypothetical protein n=1 Tax=Dolichospermum planctonicum TaxID=136072 RepID=UPI001F4147AD
ILDFGLIPGINPRVLIINGLFVINLELIASSRSYYQSLTTENSDFGFWILDFGFWIDSGNKSEGFDHQRLICH